MPTVTLTVTIQKQPDMDATWFQVPESAVQALGKGKKPPVLVTLNGFSYRSTIAVYGGEYMLPLAKVNRVAAGVNAGDVVEVTLALDDQVRQVELPADARQALAATPDGLARFEALSFTHRKEHVRAIEDAKTPATRARRIAKMVELVTGQG